MLSRVEFGWHDGKCWNISVARYGKYALFSVALSWKNKTSILKISLVCFALFWYFRCGIWKLQLTEFAFQLHLFAVERLDIHCDTVLYFGICILRCLSDLSLCTCEIQLFHSSTGLIVLSVCGARCIQSH